MRNHHHIYDIKVVRPVVHRAVFPSVQSFTGAGPGPSPGSEYLIMQLDNTYIRKGIRIIDSASYLVTDKTLTPTGFAGVEDTDWVNLRLASLLDTDEIPEGAIQFEGTDIYVTFEGNGFVIFE